MGRAPYVNFGHYIAQAWAATPKQSFRDLAAHIAAARGTELRGELLDIGCASGELLAYLQSVFPAMRATGMDVFEELLGEARKRVASAAFVKGSALELPRELRGAFDVVTAMGVMSIFDETEIAAFWDNALAAAKPDGLLIVLAPLNEYGVDTMIRHRKRMGGRVLGWETGWNIHAMETITEIVAALGRRVRFERFGFEGSLEPRADPVRTWTLATADNPRQLTNGLKLLVDHYFMIVDGRDPARRPQP